MEAMDYETFAQAAGLQQLDELLQEDQQKPSILSSADYNKLKESLQRKHPDVAFANDAIILREKRRKTLPDVIFRARISIRAWEREQMLLDNLIQPDKTLLTAFAEIGLLARLQNQGAYHYSKNTEVKKYIYSDENRSYTKRRLEDEEGIRPQRRQCQESDVVSNHPNNNQIFQESDLR